ncbi:MAG: CCA tRNA nucleotidyltransferase [Erysipelotrichia bacterium]|jgi:tRNA nucleotidyltransferase/poly(A) polymerase|nr:CCA tRNA nucleotidyltransferase [Erysipelotrichia bacterium]
MDKKVFLDLANLFEKFGFSLYIIGGTSRDFLLGRPVDDYDFVTDATPNEMKKFLENADYTFAKFGTIRFTFYGKKVDIVTLRTEGKYADYRHPKTIKYIRNIEDDYIRRDFTINALYIDKNFNVFDFSDGLSDLKRGVIRFIGDPEKRIIEDPLRILRAERFAKKLGFTIDEQALKAMNKHRYLLKELNPDKVREEQNK